MPPFYRLGNALNAIAGGAQLQDLAPGSVQSATEADGSSTLVFIQQAQVAEVQVAGCRVYINGATVYADGATDEPFEAGQMVYVSQTQGGGYIIHGSVKT